MCDASFANCESVKGFSACRGEAAVAGGVSADPADFAAADDPAIPADLAAADDPAVPAEPAAADDPAVPAIIPA
ncbi:MAG: hypothetical protein RSC40_08930, partial [Clostridia bacterium]